MQLFTHQQEALDKTKNFDGRTKEAFRVGGIAW